MEFLTNKKIDTAQVLSILKQDVEKHIDDDSKIL